MNFRIKEIILWPRSADYQPRRLRFELGAVNVISGVSRTGKSAIIPIIDYCFGADKCTIPVQAIRRACEWFGVLVQTKNGERLFARREPGNQRATGDVFLASGPAVDIPRRINSKNSNLETLKRTLDQLSGLSALDF